MEIRYDVIEKLQEKGIIADTEQIDRVMESFRSALLEKGYWDILNETIELSELKKTKVTMESILIGNQYEILPVETVKPSLHRKKVKVLEKGKVAVNVEILQGRHKGSKMAMFPRDLKRASVILER
ncbi:hypothetical protein MZM54_03230 [[Brevibacterium] frigoritolerans]|nr:hypothetical protein [Peribacillus frigoritolerans]